MPPWLKGSHPFSFTLVGWLVVQLLPLLGDIVEPEDEDARPEGDGESDEEQGDQVLHGCKHEDDFITVPLTVVKEDVDELGICPPVRMRR